MAADRRQQLERDRARGGGARVRHQDAELVAAEAGNDVGLAHPARDHRGHAADQLVALGVAERVVDVLEAVDVEQDHRPL